MTPLNVNGVNTGYMKGPDNRIYEQTAGSPGVSQAQLKKTAGQGVEMPSSASHTVVGAHPLDEEYLQQRHALTQSSLDTNEAQRVAEVKAAEEGRAVAKEQFVAATAARDEQQKQIGQLQSAYDQQIGVRQQALKDYTGSKVDPDRIFHGPNGGAQRVVSAIASAIGAWAATKSGAPNFAQQIIDNSINRDIAAQEAEIRIKKDAADNALSDLMRRGMDLGQAKSALAYIQRDWAAQQINLAKGVTQSDQINAAHDNIANGLLKKNLDDDEQSKIDAQGRATDSVAAQYKYPVAGTAGGVRPVSAAKGLQLAGQTAGVEGQVAGTAKTIDEIGKEKTTKAGTTKAQKLADIEASKAQLAKFENTWVKAGRPGVFNTGYFGSDVSQDLGAQVDTMAPGLGRVMEGNAPNESTMKGIRESALSGDSTKIQSWIDAQKLMLHDREKSIENGPDNSPEEAPRKE
jgi:hypothetical protein